MSHCDWHVIAIQRPFADFAALTGRAVKDEKLAFVLVHLQAHAGTAIEAVLDNRGHLELLRFVLIYRLALSPRPASEIGTTQQTCGPTCRARKLAAFLNVHQNSIAGFTRRLVAHLLIVKER